MDLLRTILHHEPLQVELAVDSHKQSGGASDGGVDDSSMLSASSEA